METVWYQSYCQFSISHYSWLDVSPSSRLYLSSFVCLRCIFSLKARLDWSKNGKSKWDAPAFQLELGSMNHIVEKFLAFNQNIIIFVCLAMKHIHSWIPLNACVQVCMFIWEFLASKQWRNSEFCKTVPKAGPHCTWPKVNNSLAVTNWHNFSRTYLRYIHAWPLGDGTNWKVCKQIERQE
jgi:hypothetical protein